MIKVGFLTTALGDLMFVIFKSTIEQFFEENTFELQWCFNPDQVNETHQWVVCDTTMLPEANVAWVKLFTKNAPKATLFMLGNANQKEAAEASGFIFIDVKLPIADMAKVLQKALGKPMEGA